MSKILRNEELEEFIKTLNIKCDEQIFSIIISIDEEGSKYIINGEQIVSVDKKIIEQFM